MPARSIIKGFLYAALFYTGSFRGNESFVPREEVGIVASNAQAGLQKQMRSETIFTVLISILDEGKEM